MSHQVNQVMSVCWLIAKGKILLGLKKVVETSPLGHGLYNGFGGHNEPPDSIEETAMGEFKAESGLSVIRMKKAGILVVSYQKSDLIAELHYYVVTEYDGEPKETEEMIPKWFPLDKIPYEQMWPSDKEILPPVLAGKKFIGTFVMDDPKSQKRISSHIAEVKII
ncbi:MAG: 8-oxo-dGTP diphosphatase [Patescibacteria group bacterium]